MKVSKFLKLSRLGSLAADGSGHMEKHENERITSAVAVGTPRDWRASALFIIPSVVQGNFTECQKLIETIQI
jgi:hypothetical protein